MSGDPHAPRRVNVTIKTPESKRYAADNPWLTFEGTVEAVRSQIIEAFQLEETDGLSLFEVALNAQRIASGVGGAAQSLGGTVLSPGKSEDKPATESKSEDDETAPIKAMIAAAGDRDALKKIWAENKAVFDANPSLMDEWKAKGKSLPPS